MGLDITNISYLAFRLAPFILVCLFMLQSLLNYDLKGIIYLAGLLFATVLVIMTKGLLESSIDNSSDNVTLPDARCQTITLGNNGELLSSVPLSIATYSYTFFYLLIFIFNLGNRSSKGILGGNLNSSDLNAAFTQNIPIMVIFPALIILEVLWQIQHHCTSKPVFFITAAIVIGGAVGVVWATIITHIGKNELMYLTASGVETCSRPSKTYFSCKKANGSTKKDPEIVVNQVKHRRNRMQPAVNQINQVNPVDQINQFHPALNIKNRMQQTKNALFNYYQNQNTGNQNTGNRDYLAHRLLNKFGRHRNI